MSSEKYKYNAAKIISNFFLPEEVGAFGNNIEKEPHTTNTNTKTTPKIKKIGILYIYCEHLLCLQPNANCSILQKYINFVEQLTKFSHFGCSIIP